MSRYQITERETETDRQRQTDRHRQRDTDRQEGGGRRHTYGQTEHSGCERLSAVTEAMLRALQCTVLDCQFKREGKCVTAIESEK